jgi:hypothetical protein
MQRLQDMGFSEQQAELFVQRAFGWGPKARSYWRHEKVSNSLQMPAGHCVVTYYLYGIAILITGWHSGCVFCIPCG